MWLYSQNFGFIRTIRTSVFFAVRFTLFQSSPSVKNATHLRTFCFLDFIYAFGQIFVNQHVLLQLDVHWASPKLPWGMQRIYQPFVLKTIVMPFKRLPVLLWYVPPHSCAFHTFCFRPIISYVYYHLKYFSYPLWFCWSAKARNGIIQWNFA